MTRPAAIGRLPRVLFSRPHRRRRRALWAIAIAVVIIGCSGVGTAIAYMSVKSQANLLQAQLTVHLQRGRSELEAAKASLKAATSARDEKLIAQADVHFTTAKLQFMVARQMADSSELLSRLEGLPAVGNLAQSRHTAVDGIPDMGVAISHARPELSQLDGQLIPPTRPGRYQAPTLLTGFD